MVRSLVVAIGLWVPVLCATMALGHVRRRSASWRRSLEVICIGKELAATVKSAQVPNLQYQALGSPNPEVVEFLRRSHKLPVNDLQIAAIRGDRMDIRRQLRQLDEQAKKAALVNGYIYGLLSNSPLSLAVRNGHTDAVRELITAGAEVNECSAPPEMRPRNGVVYGTTGRAARSASHCRSNSSGVRYPSDE